ncbi:MAG: amidohydrolase family protein [Planctomycetota bacterium]
MRTRISRLPLSLGAVLAVAGLSGAQSGIDDRTPAEKLLEEPQNLAFVGVDVYTVDAKSGKGKRIEGVTVLVEDGKFSKIGKDIDVPSSFRKVEGGVLAPGLVFAGTTAGLPRSRSPAPRMRIPIRFRGRFRFPRRSRSSTATFSPTRKVSSLVKPEDEAFAKLLRGGVTTLGIRPTKAGISGQGAVFRTAGHTSEDMLIKDEALLYVGMQSDTKTKEMLSGNFEKARKLIEERAAAKKKAEEAKKAAAKKPDAKKPAPPAKGKSPKKDSKKVPPKKEPPKKEPPKKEPPKKEPPKKEPAKQKPKEGSAKKGDKAVKPTAAKKKKEDPKIAVLARAVERKLPVLLRISGARDLLHALDALEESEFPLVVAHFFSRGATDTLDRVLPALEKRKASVILPVELAFEPQTRYYKNVVGEIMSAGIRTILVPCSNRGIRSGRVQEIQSELESLWFRIGELYRSGIPREKLFAALTYEPARLLGVEKRLGSIAKGKDANFLHFTRDPFSPASRLKRVYLEGRAVEAEKTRN